MRTKKIVLYYALTQEEIFPPSASELKRKEDWIQSVQQSIPPHEAKQVKLTYELSDPEVIRQQRFFNGPVIDYYIIQNENLTDRTPVHEERKRYRNTILYDMLGYTVQLNGRTTEERKSTSTFTDKQKWHSFLEELRETYFEPNGYEMPDSEQFWALEKKYGYDQAQSASIEQLQRKLTHKLSTESR